MKYSTVYIGMDVHKETFSAVIQKRTQDTL